MICHQSEKHQYNSPQLRHPSSRGEAEVDMYGNVCFTSSYSSQQHICAVSNYVACLEAEENLRKNVLQRKIAVSVCTVSTTG